MRRLNPGTDDSIEKYMHEAVSLQAGATHSEKVQTLWAGMSKSQFTVYQLWQRFLVILWSDFVVSSDKSHRLNLHFDQTSR